MSREIEHEDVPIRKDGDRYYLGEDETLSRNLEEFHEYVLFTAAAAVYNATGSLKKAASLLWWTGFSGDEEALRVWVENNQEYIIAHADSGSARTVAGLEQHPRDGPTTPYQGYFLLIGGGTGLEGGLARRFLTRIARDHERSETTIARQQFAARFSQRLATARRCFRRFTSRCAWRVEGCVEKEGACGLGASPAVLSLVAPLGESV